jgi:hypothetical protein
MPKTGVFLLTQVTPGTGPHFWITFALILERKILALAVRPQVNLPKHLAGAIPTFSYAGPIFQEP